VLILLKKKMQVVSRCPRTKTSTSWHRSKFSQLPAGVPLAQGRPSIEALYTYIVFFVSTWSLIYIYSIFFLLPVCLWVNLAHPH
jgi:hypothetical protein